MIVRCLRGSLLPVLFLLIPVSLSGCGSSPQGPSTSTRNDQFDDASTPIQPPVSNPLPSPQQPGEDDAAAPGPGDDEDNDAAVPQSIGCNNVPASESQGIFEPCDDVQVFCVPGLTCNHADDNCGVCEACVFNGVTYLCDAPLGE